jgi:hypothetical protein
MRSIGRPFVVTPPTGARIRTRLRLSEADEAVLRAVGDHLGRLASADLAWRCRLGQQDDLRTIRKRASTGQSSSRWAGAITRTSGDQWQRALANLADRKIMLRRAIRTIRSRLAVPVGSKQDRVRGYATRTERFAKRWRHHAAAVVIARRGLGVGARRRPGVPGNDQRIVAGELPTRPSRQRPGPQGPGPPGGQRAAAVPRRTRSAERSRLGDQVVQDRSGPPGQDTVLHTCQER